MIKQTNNLEDLINSELQGLGFTLVGLELTNQGRSKLLRLYVDRADDYYLSEKLYSKKLSGVKLSGEKLSGDHAVLAEPSKTGINLEDCSKINYHMNKFLSVFPELQLGEYILEVSSPGLDRKLFNLQQFRQQLGKTIRLLLKVPTNGRYNFTGILEKVDSELNKIMVKVEEQQLCFDYSNITKANLVYLHNADKRDLK